MGERKDGGTDIGLTLSAHAKQKYDHHHDDPDFHHDRDHHDRPHDGHHNHDHHELISESHCQRTPNKNMINHH